ncbi:preprotein translocase subunit SecG [Haloimpatiens sp. FM7330]|uniref:preprotein translocase subunit SecG n=1 Tax=Haloimpatiens sp. FM7330 TaxID=3298610 RepID=UPI00363522AE
MEKALIAVQIIAAIIVIVSIMMQPSKNDGFTGFGTGGRETYFTKYKVKTSESVLARITIISSIIFAVVTIAMNII